MGEPAVFVLAFALSAAFGVGGVVLGLFFGVRNVQRDEGLYARVKDQLDSIEADRGQLRLEWSKTLENLEEFAGTIERSRRRIAASESRLKNLDPQGQEPIPQTAAEMRMEARKRMRPVA